MRRPCRWIASESVSTPGVRAALGSEFGDKYAEGHPGHRYHGGCKWSTNWRSWRSRAPASCSVPEYADVQPVSGSVANLAVYAAFAQPDDARCWRCRFGNGGHQTHGSRANFSGRWFTPVSYELDMSDERIDYDKLRDTAMFLQATDPGGRGSGYSRHIDFAAMRSIADEAGCILWVDAAHIAGLAIAGIGPSPVEHADVVTVSTQKIMRGPRGGVILARRARRRAAPGGLPFVQGGAQHGGDRGKGRGVRRIGHLRVPRLRAPCRRERRGTGQRPRRRRTAGGLRGTDNHLAVIDVTELGLTGRAAADALGAAGIVVDKAVLLFDPAPVALGSAFRVGTPTVTSAGQTVSDMAVLAARILDVLAGAAR